MRAHHFFTPIFMRRAAVLAVSTALGSGLALSGCSSSKTNPSNGTPDGGGGSCTGGSGGPVTGAADTHCGSTVQTTGVCRADTGSADAGSGDAGAEEQLPPTRYGTEGDDDDCKYHIAIKFPAICENEEAMFEVTLTSKADGKPVKGASPSIEQRLNGVLGPLVGDVSTEKSGAEGVYLVPTIFNAKGQWEAKFHFFETCSDAPADSPHGHGTFYVDVP